MILSFCKSYIFLVIAKIIKIKKKVRRISLCSDEYKIIKLAFKAINKR